jgi:hypothetical protein
VPLGVGQLTGATRRRDGRPPAPAGARCGRDADPRSAAPGIGKSLADKLAKQKLNVVLVALDDAHLENTFQELKKKYPEQQFIKVRGPLAARLCRSLPGSLENE